MGRQVHKRVYVAIAGTPLETRELYHPFVTGRIKEVYFDKNITFNKNNFGK